MPLKPRQVLILHRVVERFIADGEPVSSGAVVRSGIGLSGATVRNVMADLEDQGYLAQPHTSAGRVPTALGLRSYVDELQASATRLQSVDLEGVLSVSTGGFGELASTVASLVAETSRLTGLVLGPLLEKATLRDVKLTALGPTRILVMLVTSDGAVIDRVVPMVRPVDDVALTAMQNYLAELGRDATLSEVRRRVSRELRETRDRVDVIRRALEIGDRVLDGDVGETLRVEGVANFAGHEELVADPTRFKELLESLQTRERVVELLEQVVQDGAPAVLIGPELGASFGDDLGLVVSAYFKGEDRVGTVGVLGPMRMNYAETIPLVDHAARVLSKGLDTGRPSD